MPAPANVRSYRFGKPTGGGTSQVTGSIDLGSTGSASVFLVAVVTGWSGSFPAIVLDPVTVGADSMVLVGNRPALPEFGFHGNICVWQLIDSSLQGLQTFIADIILAERSNPWEINAFIAVVDDVESATGQVFAGIARNVGDVLQPASAISSNSNSRVLALGFSAYGASTLTGASGTTTVEAGLAQTYHHWAMHRVGPTNPSATVGGAADVYAGYLWSLEGSAGPGPATGITLSGPASGPVGSPSTNFTVGANGTITGTITVTPSDSGGGGTFTPSSVNISSGTPTATFTYTPGSAGVKSISVTNNGGLTNPSASSFTASVPPATKIDLTIPAAAGLTGIRWAVFGAAALSGGASVIASGTAESFNGAGLISLDISGLGVALGAVRYVVLTQSNGDPAQSPIPYGWHGPATAS